MATHSPEDGLVVPLFLSRWSPYAFEPRAVEPEKLHACLAAARWAASSYNEQPWRFIVAGRENELEFARALDCLTEANQGWARHAGVLVLTAIRPTFTHNGKPNRVALHDLGAAAAHFALQAAAMGLQAHQMAGVELEKVRQTYQLGEDLEPATAIALGYPATAGNAPDAALLERDAGERTRRAVDELLISPR